MKRLILAIFTLISVTLNAQNISVSDFRLDEMDLTANQQGTIVLDQNGEKCALIKVKTTQTGFNFDAGSLGVTKTLQKTAEIWVYVPHGVRKLNISHQKYGQLDYQLPLTTQKAKTYIMVLKAETPLPVDHQRLTIKCQPKNAIVSIDGEMAETPNGVGEVTLKLGSHKYVAMAQGHYQMDGTFNLVADRPGRLSIDLEAQEQEQPKTPTVNSNIQLSKESKTDQVAEFSILVFSGGKTRQDKEHAFDAGAVIRRSFPNYSVYTHFKSPSWTCRMGDFKSREEAEKILPSVKNLGFSQACIIQNEKQESPERGTRPTTILNSNIAVRVIPAYELISGNQDLLSYSLVIGSFGIKANAVGLSTTLEKDGYNSIVIRENSTSMYRVIVATSNSLEDLLPIKEQLRKKYPALWFGKIQ